MQPLVESSLGVVTIHGPAILPCVRQHLGQEYKKQVLAVLSQWESDVQKSKEAEEKLQNMFKQQHKLFQQQRIVQSQRLKTIKQLHDQFTKVSLLSIIAPCAYMHVASYLCNLSTKKYVVCVLMEFLGTSLHASEDYYACLG